jgi:cupin domain
MQANLHTLPLECQAILGGVPVSRLDEGVVPTLSSPPPAWLYAHPERPARIAALPPWFEPREVTFAHRGEEFGMVLSGKPGIAVDGREYESAAGEGSHFKFDVPHLWSHRYPEPAVVLRLHTPRLCSIGKG